MIGNPKFHEGDIVNFKYTDEHQNDITETGVICIIDRYGTFFQPDDVSYDIMIKRNGEPVLCKHIPETIVLQKIGYEPNTII
jgi:hypothetical protein